MISIIIPTLNEEKFLPRLLESLASQTQKDFEVVVVDGSSKDKTVAIAKTFAKKLPNLQVIVSDKASLPLQRNIGAKATSGEWLIFIDADIVLFPQFIERVNQYIKTNHPSLFTAWWKPDSEKSHDAILTLLANMMLELSVVLHKPFPPGPLTAMTRTVYTRVGGYDERHAFNEDMDFGIRAHAHHIPLQILHETLSVLSLRRLRKEGTLKVVQQYALASLPVVLFNRTLKFMPGYIMGGHLYDRKKKKINTPALRNYEEKLKSLMKEFLE